MKVSEIFLSVQGEGPSIGTPSVFLRLASCNLRCSFCDSKYSWEGGYEATIAQVAKSILILKIRQVVITGGEPLLQQRELEKLLDKLLRINIFFNFEVETNGTLEPSPRMLELVDRWIVSPKDLENQLLGKWFIDDSKRGDEYLKFVIDTKEDITKAVQFVENNGPISHHNVFLMPCAITAEEQITRLPILIETAKQYGFRVTPRLHILAFGNRRGC